MFIIIICLGYHLRATDLLASPLSLRLLLLCHAAQIFPFIIALLHTGFWGRTSLVLHVYKGEQNGILGRIRQPAERNVRDYLWSLASLACKSY